MLMTFPITRSYQDTGYVDREGINSLCDAISDDIERSSRGGRVIPPMTQLLVTLRYLAKGDFLSEVSDLHGVSRSSASRIIHWCVIALNKHIDNIRFPTGNELNKVKLGFYQKCGIPNTVGAIDGTLIPIIAPKDNEDVFVCRKGYHALNVQAVVDSSMRCLHKSGGCLLFTPRKSAQVVICCMKLHNFCKQRGLEAPEPIADLDDDDFVVDEIEHVHGNAKRRSIVQLFE